MSSSYIHKTELDKCTRSLKSQDEERLYSKETEFSELLSHIFSTSIQNRNDFLDSELFTIPQRCKMTDFCPVSFISWI